MLNRGAGEFSITSLHQYIDYLIEDVLFGSMAFPSFKIMALYIIELKMAEYFKLLY
jgi:hypothetical protein